MRAKEFIFEDPHTGAAYSDDFAAVIRRDCVPFIQANRADLENHRFIYRGINTQSSNEVISGTVRTDRRPRDTAHQWHELLDRFFVQQFGVRYRSAALFVSNVENNTYDYGQPYVIFPKGEYKMCYSSLIEDVTVDLAGGLSNMSVSISPAVSGVVSTIPDQVISQAAHRLGMNFNSGTDLLKAIRNFGSGKTTDSQSKFGFEYDRLLPNANFPELLLELLLPNLGYKETLRYSDAGDSEIMIDCREYYGIRLPRVANERYSSLIHSILNP